jgi:CPA1 family monovalent cation:H+ antiporter
MHHEAFLHGTIWIFLLLTLATVIYPLSKKVKLPYAVLLLSAGFILQQASSLFMTGFVAFEFSADMVFFVFLPTLIFESAYHINLRHFRGLFKEIAGLAIIGLLISILITGFGLQYVIGIPLGAALLFGALISATDPVAVLSIFKELKAPKKLTTIVDGESLLNDATALVIFQFLLLNWNELSISHLPIQGLLLIKNIVLGLAIGAGFGYFFSQAIGQARDKGVQMTLSLILAHLTFITAESFFGVSGILATMAAGMMMASQSQTRMNAETRKSFSDIWKFLEFVSNSLIFLLLGFKLAQMPLLIHWKLIVISILITVVVARPVSVFSSFALTNQFRKKVDKTPFSYQLLTVWGGIRGVLAAALLFLLPEDFPYLTEFYAMTTGVILATFFLKATTIPFWMRQFKFIRLSKRERLQQLEAELLIKKNIQNYLTEIYQKKYIRETVFEKLFTKYQKEEFHITERITKTHKNIVSANDRESETILSHYALGIETKAYKRLFELHEIGSNRLHVLVSSINRQIDRIEKDILPHEQLSTIKYAPSIPSEKKSGLFNTFYVRYRNRMILERYQHYRARNIASWQVLLDFKRLKDQHHFFHESQIVDKIILRYETWNHNAELKLKSLEKRFPKVIKPFLLTLTESVCLQKEHDIEYELHEKGLISAKVLDNMEAKLRKKFSCCKQKTLFKSVLGLD